MTIVLTDEEIEKLDIPIMVKPETRFPVPFEWQCYRAIRQAQLKKVYNAFENGGIYEVQKDGAYFWNPIKFREFWQALKKEAGL